MQKIYFNEKSLHLYIYCIIKVHLLIQSIFNIPNFRFLLAFWVFIITVIRKLAVEDFILLFYVAQEHLTSCSKSSNHSIQGAHRRACIDLPSDFPTQQQKSDF